MPPGPAWNPWDAELAAEAPKPPPGPWLKKDCAPALAALAPNPFGPNCWLKAFALACALDDPNPLLGNALKMSKLMEHIMRIVKYLVS